MGSSRGWRKFWRYVKLQVYIFLFKSEVNFTFKVVTTFKLKCYRYTNSIYAGMIMYPLSAVDEISNRVAEFVKRPDLKMALHVFMGDVEGRALKGEQPNLTISLLVFDAHGEEHGRSDAGFKWALDIPGAVDTTKSMNLKAVNQLQGKMAESI
jgi:hypothetical protein